MIRVNLNKWHLLLTLCGLAIWSQSFAQAGKWIWVTGDTINFDTGYYGIKGIFSPLNTPCARAEPAYWSDLNGNFWLFGGDHSIHDTSSTHFLNDLWMFDVQKRMWVWMSGAKYWQNQPGISAKKGMPCTNCYPGARGNTCPTWTDNNNNLWIYSGAGVNRLDSFNSLNDLWKYNISNNEWTWVWGNDTGGRKEYYVGLKKASPKNAPGYMALNRAAWVDDENNLWLYGGIVSGTYVSKDIWKFDTKINQWLLVRRGKPTHFGVIGLEDSLNEPPEASYCTNWKDNKNNLYICSGFDYVNTYGFYNSLWRFNIKTLSWSWLSGSRDTNSIGRYTSYCKSDTTNYPCGRALNMATVSMGCPNLFYLFGGDRLNFNSHGLLAMNDLWVYNPLTNKWKWLSGVKSSVSHDSGYYGVKGVYSPRNHPCSREGTAMWVDNKGHVWIFGSGGFRNNSDMWEFIPDSTCLTPSEAEYVKPVIRDTTLQCDSTITIRYNGIIINNVSPKDYAQVLKDSSGIYFNPTDTTLFTITFTQNPCGYTDTFSYKINVKPCPTPPPVISYIQTYISSGGYWNIVNKTTPLSVKVYDALGQVLYQNANYQNTLDTRKWASGVYLYSVIDGNGNKYVGKMVVVRS